MFNTADSAYCNFYVTEAFYRLLGSGTYSREGCNRKHKSSSFNLIFVDSCIITQLVKTTNVMPLVAFVFITPVVALYMFRVLFAPIIRSVLKLYMQLLVQSCVGVVSDLVG